jgi:hypothetical protein
MAVLVSRSDTLARAAAFGAMTYTGVIKTMASIQGHNTGVIGKEALVSVSKWGSCVCRSTVSGGWSSGE